ncbi:tyrosine-type recombinase/integrase [Xylanimonas ulmi]|uniref:tyrosine-type recombinase/integrase n=1 Tax=Xylanimonas ulmi TaxID=228973 RepID=UPI0013EE7850|nr:site-specific integrase [Xylanibacterium ulmi]
MIRKYEARGASGAEAQRRLEDKPHRVVTDATVGGLMPIAPETRMNVVFDQWVAEKHAEAQVVPQSMEKYVGVLDRDLRPALGALRVREVTPVAVNRVLMALTKARKYATARQCRNVMQQVMMLCVRYGAAPHNPVRDAMTVRTPKRGEVRTIPLEDIALLRKAVRAWEDRPAIRGLRNVSMLPQIVDTMLGTGLRIGECLALREEDLDLDAEVPTLTVEGTVVRAGGKLLRQPMPKSDSSRRTISLPNFVVVALREALDLGLDGGPDGLVFPTSTARPRSPSNVRTQLKHAQQGTGLDIRPHDFRRTVGTMVANTTSIASASAQLGHAGEATTRLHYVKRNRLAPDLRVVIDQLVTQASADLAAGTKKQ